MEGHPFRYIISQEDRRRESAFFAKKVGDRNAY